MTRRLILPEHLNQDAVEAADGGHRIILSVVPAQCILPHSAHPDNPETYSCI
jgi:hypothetical protein